MVFGPPLFRGIAFPWHHDDLAKSSLAGLGLNSASRALGKLRARVAVFVAPVRQANTATPERADVASRTICSS